MAILVVLTTGYLTGADPGIFERGGPKAIIYKTVERGGPKTLKMAFECSFQSFSYKSFANIPQQGGALAPWAPPLNPPLPKLISRLFHAFHELLVVISFRPMESGDYPQVHVFIYPYMYRSFFHSSRKIKIKRSAPLHNI